MNLFEKLGNALSSGLNAVGEGMATQQLGPDWRQKAEMLARLNEIELQVKGQQPEIQRMQAESMVYNRRALEDAARERARQDRIGRMTGLFLGGQEPDPALLEGADPMDLASARGAAALERQKLGGRDDMITLGVDMPAIGLKKGQQISKSELQSLTSLHNDSTSSAMPKDPQAFFDSEGMFRIENGRRVYIPGAPGANRYGETKVADPVSNRLAGFRTISGGLDKIASDLKARGGALGPITGRIADLSETQLGGLGLSPETTRLLIDIKTGRKGASFAEGGKQLTGTEYNQFLEILPNEKDNLQQALIKIEEARRWLAINQNAYESMLDPSIRSRLGVGPNVDYGANRARLATEPASDIDEIEALLRNR